MLRYSVTLLALLTVAVAGCKNQPVIGDPFGRTRIPTPTTGGVVTQPTAVPYYNPSTSPPPSSLAPIPGAPGTLPVYPGASGSQTYPPPQTLQPPATGTFGPGTSPSPQGQQIYPPNSTIQPGTSGQPGGTGSIRVPSQARTLAARPSTGVQPVALQPRLRPVPTFGRTEPADHTEPTSSPEIADDVQTSDRSSGPFVVIEEGNEGEPVIRIEEPTPPELADDDWDALSPADDETQLATSTSDSDRPSNTRGSVLTKKVQRSSTPPAPAIAWEESEPSIVVPSDVESLERASVLQRPKPATGSVLVRSSTPAATPARGSVIVPAGHDEPAEAPTIPNTVAHSKERSRIDIATLPPSTGDAKPSTAQQNKAQQNKAQFRAVQIMPPAKYGHAEDYSWLKGKLEYSAARKQWKLRYVPLDGNTDEYGGSVVLNEVDSSQYSDGDFVAVRGWLGERDAEASDYSTSYHVQKMKSM